jgi:hypothetical protein
MSTTPQQFVPKVHPLDRAVEPEDPLELVAAPVAGGDPDFMLQCVIEEFAWLGWDADGLMGLFRDPGYPMLNGLAAHFGEDEVRRRVEAQLGLTGRLRFTETIADDEPEGGESDLVQVSVTRLAEPRGSATRR